MDKEKLLGHLTLVVLFVIQCSIIIGSIQNRKWHLHDDTTVTTVVVPTNCNVRSLLPQK